MNELVCDRNSQPKIGFGRIPNIRPFPPNIRTTIYAIVNPVIYPQNPHFLPSLKRSVVAQFSTPWWNFICIWFDVKFRQIESSKFICILFDGKIRKFYYYKLNSIWFDGNFVNLNTATWFASSIWFDGKIRNLIDWIIYFYMIY